MDRDLALIERLGQLYPAVVADCLDRLGLRTQVLEPHIRPLYADAKVAGYAATVHCVDVDAVPDDRADWYRGEMAAVDSLQPGDVMVVSSCRGSYWGELLATASRYRGARGLVADAYTRDTLALIGDAVPNLRGGNPLRGLARTHRRRRGRLRRSAAAASRSIRAILCLGDNDGVVVIPSQLGAEVIGLAEEKVSGEDVVRAKLAEGCRCPRRFGCTA